MCAIALEEHRADLDGADDAGFDIDLPVFSVGLAAQLADIHPQTLRQYDRLNLIVPQRTEGGARRYSLRDIERLVRAQHLSQDEGVTLSGVAYILRLEEENRQLRRDIKRLKERGNPSVFAADADGDITEVRRSTQARHWRREMSHRVRELPSGSQRYGDRHGVRSGSGVAYDGGVQGMERGDAGLPFATAPEDSRDSLADAHALVLWQDYLD